jgi:hypothetical protein
MADMDESWEKLRKETVSAEGQSRHTGMDVNCDA